MKNRAARAIMIQGTGSYVGKSVIVSALCRIFRQDGLRVAPFKAQNMALNSFVTRDGGEMGRAQATQAEAAGIEPDVDMNPVLLKPSADVKAQVIIRGRPVGNMGGREYYRHRPMLLKTIRESYERLREQYDVIVIEGAGSPAEINLRKHDVVNMAMARLADCPVVLAGDINVGGVFASLVGTLELLTPAERRRIRGVIINKFRGDLSILKPGLVMLEKRLRRPVLGVIPYFHDIRIPEEDSVCRERYAAPSAGPARDKVNIDVIYLPHISNFTDFDPLENEPGVRVRYVSAGERLESPDCVIIPGSKNTIGDLAYLRSSGLAAQVLEAARQGAAVVGICGGYQMLGGRISDPGRVESTRKPVTGLGLLPVTTVMAREKVTRQVAAEDYIFGTGRVTGYEIHMGVTRPAAPCGRAFTVHGRSGRPADIADGAVSANRKVWGSYIHGLFDNDRFRRRFIDSFEKRGGRPGARGNAPFAEVKEREYDKLADLVRKNIDMRRIYALLK